MLGSTVTYCAPARMGIGASHRTHARPRRQKSRTTLNSSCLTKSGVSPGALVRMPSSHSCGARRPSGKRDAGVGHLMPASDRASPIRVLARPSWVNWSSRSSAVPAT
jgi:hypothetical protein